jgi:hypothetical protein
VRGAWKGRVSRRSVEVKDRWRFLDLQRFQTFNLLYS